MHDEYLEDYLKVYYSSMPLNGMTTKEKQIVLSSYGYASYSCSRRMQVLINEVNTLNPRLVKLVSFLARIFRCN